MAAKKRSAADTAPARSESTEDHLERIHDLVESKGYARVTDIAEALQLSRSTVSNMVRRLAKRGYVNYERYRGFTLTAEGVSVARHIRHRHRILTDLLQMLGLGEDVVVDDVEDMEHHLKPQTLQAFESLVEYWRSEAAAHRDFMEFHRRRRRR